MKDIKSMTILDIQESLRKNEISSHDLTLFYLKRIATIDNGIPTYNSILEVNPDALNIAKKLDYERSQGLWRSNMHGIPVILKDNINTKDKMHTTAGANILKNHFALRDAFIAKTLREQGAIILGKANLTELACFKSFDTVNGYSSLGGYVLCPWNIKEDPSGSSTGSAVSVSLNLAPVSIGTETGGSIMSPSMKNGVVGLKPTIGFVSRNGIVPISSTLDTAGPIGKTVTDVSVLLSSIKGNDKEDPITMIKDEKSVDYTSFLIKDALNGKRIGVDRTGYDKLSPKRQEAFNHLLSIFRESGAEVIEKLAITQTKLIYHVMKYEFKRNIETYLNHEGLEITLADIVQYNQENDKENLKFGQQVLEDVLNHTTGRMNEKEYYEALKERDDARKKLDIVFKDHKLDMIYFASYTSLGPHCGYPTMTIPVGFDEDNMPIGVYFLAPMNREDTLISIGYDVESKINMTFDPIHKASK